MIISRVVQGLRFLNNVRKLRLEESISTSMVQFNSNGDELKLLCDRYGSDKGSMHIRSDIYEWPSHTYTEVYDWILRSDRDKIKFVFECGIGTANRSIEANMGDRARPGASLRVWRDYFPNAVIYGADIDINVLFEEERIKTGHIDQTNPVSINMYFEQLGQIQFDLMVDDGLHNAEAAICLFSNAFKSLKKGGHYFIEDLGNDSLKTVRDFLLKQQVTFTIYIMTRNGLPTPIHNSLIHIRGL